MGFELKAEYVEQTVLLWHIVPVKTSTALCHHFLSPPAEPRPITDIDRLHLRADQLCLRCANTHRLRAGQQDAGWRVVGSSPLRRAKTRQL